MNSLVDHVPAVNAAVCSAGTGSFTAAAAVLNLTPAAISKNVAALERHLGVRLFNRTTRRLTLTDEGRAFVAQAKLAMDALQHAGTLATQHQAASGLVRVNCAVGFGRHFVLPLLPAFFKAHPLVQVELSLNDQHVDLLRDGFDVGIRGGLSPPDGMVARRIGGIPAVVVATPTYLRLRGTPKRMEDLAQHDLLRVKFSSGKTMPWLFKSGQQTMAFEGGQTRLLISDPEVILDAALLHMGIARMGRHHAHAALQRGQLIELLPKLNVPGELSMALYYPHRAGLAPRVRVFVDFMLAAFANEPAFKV